MEWTRAGDAEINDADYRVQAVRVDGAWRFVAWAPDIGDIRPLCHERYAIGDRMPARRACLGVFDAAADARLVCTKMGQVLPEPFTRGAKTRGFWLGLEFSMIENAIKNIGL